MIEFLNGDNQPWMSAGLCATSTDPDAWFPTELHAERAAKVLCKGCPVRSKCFQYAVDNPELEGIWGGTTDRQRAKFGKRGSDAA